MLNGKGNENDKTEKTKPKPKKETSLHVQHTCLYIFCCFPLETSRDFLITRFMRKCCMCFCLLIFFTAAHFYLGGRQLLTASIAFSCFSFNETRLFCTLSLASALSLSSTSVQTLNFCLKKKKKKGLGLVVIFPSLSPGGHAIYHQNARVLEIRYFTPTYIKGWAYLRGILSEPKFLRCKGNRFFFTHSASLSAPHARGLRHNIYITT